LNKHENPKRILKEGFLLRLLVVLILFDLNFFKGRNILLWPLSSGVSRYRYRLNDLLNREAMLEGKFRNNTFELLRIASSRLFVIALNDLIGLNNQALN
jgi:hypothetical protein